MLESNLNPGKQAPNQDRSALEYGVSITDACIGWDETEVLLREAYNSLGRVTVLSCFSHMLHVNT
jgi:3-deoxy-7-phosphoheptulonate synthase